LHTVERLYGCGWCGKMFRCKMDLNQHTKLHTGNKYVFSVYGEAFIICPNLDSHVRTNTGEKPYLCCTCGIHFTQKWALTKHSVIHAIDHPEQCSVCNKCLPLLVWYVSSVRLPYVSPLSLDGINAVCCVWRCCSSSSPITPTIHQSPPPIIPHSAHDDK